MNRKIIGIVAAIALAAVGTFALVGYVQSAKDDAVAGERQVEAYVVRDAVSKGATVDQVRDAVERTEVPAKVRPDDAVTDLDDLDDELVAAVDLAPGELLLSSRLIQQEDLTRAQVPEGLQELTVAFEPQRAVGGSIRPGDTVGIVISFEPFDLPNDGQGGDQSEKTPNMTHLTFHKILVTSVQFDQNEAAADDSEGDGEGDESDDETVERAPSSQLLVTLALSSPQVEQVVFAAEFGHIWLTAENAQATEDGTRVVTLGEVYGGATVPAG
jgi:pilus assembly protein CpaB